RQGVSSKMHWLKIVALSAMAALAVAAGPAARRNWNTVIAVTPTGSHVLGNPAAKVKLTEFISYTCNHCAQFDREASDRLRVTGVAQGTVSVEVRHLVRDPIDMTVAMLTNCGPSAKFFLNHTAFLRSQDRWIAAANNAGDAQRQRWSTGDMPSRMRAIASDFGFYSVMASRGYDRTLVDRCLADRAMAQRLAAQTEAASKLGVTGTPSFLINGELLAGTHSWDMLQPQIESRL
ncbi:MAG: DsbA family protein, partial [Novosphingobium sp.]